MMAQEGHLSSTALLSGFEGVRTINYDRPGTVYSTMFHLSTGFERLLKIVVILQHRFDNDLAFPTNKKLTDLSHSLDGLYNVCSEGGKSLGIDTGWPEPETHHATMLTVLTEFAKGSRYHNLNQMVGGYKNSDPLIQWFAAHVELANDVLTYRRREAVMQRARVHCENNGLLGWEMGPFGRYDLTIDVTYQLEITRLTTGHLVWIFLELIKPIYRVLDRLVRELGDIEQTRGNDASVPDMTEFFPFGLTLREDALRRKQWTKLFYIAGRF